MTSKLPEPFVRKMEKLLQDEKDAFFATYSRPRTAGLRLNPLKLTENDWLKINPFSLKKIPFAKNGFYYDINQDEPGKHPYHAAGLYYIQEPSAMFITSILDAKPGEKILDLCAAPGGKSTQIGAAMENEGILIANEIHPKRAKALSENIERFGLKNTIVTNESPENLSSRFENYFDKILVDAPCSGEGMFRKDEDAIFHWSEAHVLACHEKQLQILEHAYQMLKEIGTIVYSTCTFSPEENEQTIEQFLEKHPDVELSPIDKPPGVENGRPEWTEKNLQIIEHCARLWPHKIKGEGHFVAKLIKTAPTAETKVKETSLKKKQQFKDFYLFEQQFLQTKPFPRLSQLGNQLYSLPAECPDLNGIKVLRAGLHLGELKKNRFEPNHALALALQPKECRQTHYLTTQSTDWLKFLKGETLKGTGQKGWVLVTIDGFSLGWGKEVKGILKNFYPKGLRVMF